MLGFESLRGSGTETFIERPESGFNVLKIGYGCQATVTAGEIYSVVIRIDDNLSEYLRIEQEGERLSIGMEPYKSYRDFNFAADVTMPDITALELSGGSEGQLNGFNLNHSVSIDLSGGSELEGDLIASQVTFSLSGGSEVRILGNAEQVSLGGSGGSWIELQDFNARILDFDLSGGTTAKVSADETISGNASGGSTVQYRGNAQLKNISKSGGSNVDPF
jgi:hypothetical protein